MRPDFRPCSECNVPAVYHYRGRACVGYRPPVKPLPLRLLGKAAEATIVGLGRIFYRYPEE